MKKMFLILSLLSISSAAFATQPSFVLSCQKAGQKSTLVATDINSRKRIEAGTFQGGGWSASESIREASSNCMDALTIQAPCVALGRTILFACEANGQGSDLVVTDLLTGVKTNTGTFQGGGWSASEAIREATTTCLVALKTQISCQ